MASYKQDSLIPAQAAEEEGTPSREAIGEGPEQQIPLVPAAGAPIAPPPQPPAVATAGKAKDLWSNGRWVVTEAGLESRHQLNGQPIDYPIEKERLLDVLPGTAISMWAEQVAGKSWLDAPEALIAALTEALRRHHPGQTVIDLDATREYAMREWRRTHHQKRDPALGWEYQPGEATLRRLELRNTEAKPTSDHPGTTDGGGPPSEPWVMPIVNRIRDALTRHGVDPAAHSGGLYVNERLMLMAMGGATDEELEAAADQLKVEHVLHEEEPETEIPPEAEDYIE